jgi:uncharacterized membrane protein YdbT with pleckstrin-like domain
MEQTFENGEYYAPGKRVLYYFSVAKILPIIILFIIFSLGFDILNSLFNIKKFINIGTPFFIITGALASVVAFSVAWIKYKSVEFMFDEFAFSIRKGFFSKSEISIPYRQIQFINHSQSFNDKMLGVMNITVETAGDGDSQSSKSKEGVLPILDKDIALSIERELLKRSNVSIEKK